MTKVCVMKFGGNTLANKQKLLLAADLIKSRYNEGFIPVVVASANGNLTDVLLDHAYSLTREPDRRELDMLVTTGERVSVALLSIALRAIGVPSVSLTGSQIGLITTSSHTGVDILTLKETALKKKFKPATCLWWRGFKVLAKIRKSLPSNGAGRMYRPYF